MRICLYELTGALRLLTDCENRRKEGERMTWVLFIFCIGILICCEYFREERDYWRQKVQDYEDAEAMRAVNGRHT